MRQSRVHCLVRVNVSSHGFTLIELSIVLTVMGLLLGSSMASYTQWRAQKKFHDVEVQLERLHHHILGYAMSFGSLPCPQSLEEPESAVQIDALGNCRHYQGGVSARLFGGAAAGNDNSLVLDPWNRPVRYVLSDANNRDHGDIDRDDWTSASELKSIGAGELDGSLQICINSSDRCLQSADGYARAVLLLYSTGSDDSDRGQQSFNLDGDDRFLHAPVNIRAGTEYDDVLHWISKNELVYWLVRSAHLP